MAYIKDLPQIHFGEVRDKPVDWRAEKDEEVDDDAPASEELIALLGFDPDKYEDTETADALSQESLISIQGALAAIRESVAKLTQPKEQKAYNADVPEISANEVELNPNNTGGVFYNGYTIKQDLEGIYGIYSVGGILIGRTESLDLAMNKINDLAIKNPDSTTGIVYKGYTIKQDMEGVGIYSIGGSMIARVDSLDLAMNKINEIAVDRSE